MKSLPGYQFIFGVLLFVPFILPDQPGSGDSTVVDTIREVKKILVTVPAEAVTGKPDLLWVWITAGILLGIISGGTLIWLYSRVKIYSILKTEKRKYLNDLQKDRSRDFIARKLLRYIGLVGLLKESKDRKAEAFEKKSKEYLLLEAQNEKLKADNKNKEKIIEDLTARLLSERVAAKSGRQDQTGGNNHELFFTIPESDGSFKIINASFDKEIDCFYKIEPDRSGQKGKLYFISGNYDLRALDNIDYYLNPVCEIQNISDRTFARRIVMTDPGSVTKKGDIWKIEDNYKVKIKLV